MGGSYRFPQPNRDGEAAGPSPTHPLSSVSLGGRSNGDKASSPSHPQHRRALTPPPPPPPCAAEGKLQHLTVSAPPPPSPRRDWARPTECTERWEIQGMPDNKNRERLPGYSEEACFWHTRSSPAITLRRPAGENQVHLLQPIQPHLETVNAKTCPTCKRQVCACWKRPSPRREGAGL